MSTKVHSEKRTEHDHIYTHFLMFCIMLKFVLKILCDIELLNCKMMMVNLRIIFFLIHTTNLLLAIIFKP